LFRQLLAHGLDKIACRVTAAGITLHPVPLSETDTHAKLVYPRIYARGWTEDHIKREEMTGAVDLIAIKACGGPSGAPTSRSASS
jgi:hypothetical protein